MRVAILLSTLVVHFVFVSAGEAARQPHSQPWLAALSFTCHRSTRIDSCIGVVLDNHWVLTTVTCFLRCRGDTPQHLTVYINIPADSQRSLASAMHMGNKVNGSLVWQHPEYISSTSANNLALVKLGCHNHTLEKLNLPINCPTYENNQSTFDGYVFVRGGGRRIIFEDTERDEVNCFARLGTGAWYYLATTLQMVATRSRKSNCMVTSICEYTEQLNSIMEEENEFACISPDEKSMTVKPTLAKTVTSAQVITSTVHVIPSETSSTNTHMQQTVSPSTPSTPTHILYSPTSTTSTLVSSTQLVSSSTVSRIPISTPTQIPTSGCQLTIENGVVDSRIVDITLGFIQITYTCNAGYQFGSGRTTVVIGCTDGVMPFKPPPCERITCDASLSIDNGRVVISGSGHGATAVYTCNEGYVLYDGLTRRVCMNTNEWSGRAGVCTRACPAPPSLECNDNQKILPSSFGYTRVGESASYALLDGYVLIGEDPVCQPDSTWSTLPQCIRSSYCSVDLGLCNEKQVIPNAQVHIHRNASSYTRKIVCDERYEAVGVSDQRCARTGSWTPYFRECIKSCDEIVLVNGSVTPIPDLPQYLQLICDEGFRIDPPQASIVWCTNGEWTASNPRCVQDN